MGTATCPRGLILLTKMPHAAPLPPAPASTSIAPAAKGLNYHTKEHPWNKKRKGHLQNVSANPLRPLYAQPSKEECIEQLLNSLELLQLFRTDGHNDDNDDNCDSNEHGNDGNDHGDNDITISLEQLRLFRDDEEDDGNYDDINEEEQSQLVVHGDDGNDNCNDGNDRGDDDVTISMQQLQLFRDE